LHNDKVNQAPFVGAPSTHNKSKMADGHHLGKIKSRHISATVRPISTKFGKATQFELLEAADRLKFEILKIQDGAGRHLGKSKNRNISAAV